MMGTSFRDLHLKKKLIVISTIISTLALIISAIAWGAFTHFFLKDVFVQDIENISAFIATSDSTKQIVLSNDMVKAKNLLNHFQDDSQITAAVILDSSGNIFAEYLREGIEKYPTDFTPKETSTEFIGSNLLVYHSIEDNVSIIGTLCIYSDMQRLKELANGFRVILTIAILISVIVSLYLSKYLLGVVTRPIHHLVEMTNQITKNKDYSIRAVKESQDETGQLVDSFNEMLSEIQLRDKELKSQQESLEKQVQQRTWELSETNQQLEEETLMHKRTAQMLERSYSLLSSTLESTADGIMVININGEIETVNGKFVEMWKIPINLINSGNHQEAVKEIIRQLKDPEAFALDLEEDPSNFKSENFQLLELGDSRVFECYQKTYLIDGKISGRVLSFRDITERKRFEERLEYLAFHDQLTGLPSRSYFTDRLKRLLERKERHPDYLFAIIFLDLDRFKIINDSLGHIIGDELLVAVARSLEKCVRFGDMVARLGGDEYTVLLDDITSITDATVIAERIHSALEKPFEVGGHQVFTAGSLGIALSSNDYKHAEEMLRDADTAMYQAKTLGKGRYEVFNKEMYTKALARLQMETELRKIFEGDDLRVFYQPIILLSSGTIIGFEALLRWQHPEYGMIHPESFIGTAEETGMIVPIGRWVLRQSCLQTKKWQKIYPSDPPLSVSVNLSTKQFLQPDLVSQVKKILEETNFDPKCLKLEITETIIMEKTDFILESLNELRAMNISIHIDDFGTGYSNLSYLHRLPVDTLKIDKVFIADMGKNEENLKIVRTVISLAEDLGVQVTAEGIETSHHLHLLRQFSCDYGQGYYFSRPLAVQQMSEFLNSQPTW